MNGMTEIEEYKWELFFGSVSSYAKMHSFGLILQFFVKFHIYG